MFNVQYGKLFIKLNHLVNIWNSSLQTNRLALQYINYLVIPTNFVLFTVDLEVTKVKDKHIHSPSKNGGKKHEEIIKRLNVNYVFLHYADFYTIMLRTGLKFNKTEIKSGFFDLFFFLQYKLLDRTLINDRVKLILDKI